MDCFIRAKTFIFTNEHRSGVRNPGGATVATADAKPSVAMTDRETVVAVVATRERQTVSFVDNVPVKSIVVSHVRDRVGVE